MNIAMTLYRVFGRLACFALVVGCVDRRVGSPTTPTRGTQNMRIERALANPNRPTMMLPAPNVHVVRGDLVLLDDAAPVGIALHKENPSSAYEDTQVAAGPPLASPRRYTMLGFETACVVESTRQTFIAPGQGSPAHVAIEVNVAECGKDHRFAFAIDGAASATSAENMSGRQDNPDEVVTWVERTIGKTVDKDLNTGHEKKAAFRERVPGTDVEIIYAFFVGGSHHDMLVRRGSALLARLGDVTAVGVIHERDHHRLIVSAAGSLQALELAR